MKIKNNIYCCSDCGAKIKHQSNSFHAWVIEYTCGGKIWGAIGEENSEIDVKCPKIKGLK